MKKSELLKLKEKIEDAKKNILESKGQMKALLGQLKTDWNSKSVDEAEKLMKKYVKEYAELETSIETKCAVLEEKYFTE
jgi:hypothetical protein